MKLQAHNGMVTLGECSYGVVPWYMTDRALRAAGASGAPVAATVGEEMPATSCACHLHITETSAEIALGDIRECGVVPALVVLS